MQATRELHRFPLQALALFSVLIAAMLAALIFAGAARYSHRSAAQPASISAVGTGPTDADALYEAPTGSESTGPTDADVLGQVDAERGYTGAQVRDSEILIGGDVRVTP
jgi:hypothetical protein